MTQKRMVMPLVLCLTAASVAASSAPNRSRLQGTSSPNWLDGPLSGWNEPGSVTPKPPRSDDSRENVMRRCQLTLLGSTAGERALATAGWIPFHNFDQQLLGDGVEIVGGMAGSDGMCRPTSYNLFVFVGDRFAGVLSPVLMSSRLDASSGAVRISTGDTITAEFSRYTSTDALCCPSSHVTVRYKIDRSGTQPVVVPIERRVRP